MQNSQVIDLSAQLHTEVENVTFRVHMAAALPLTKPSPRLGGVSHHPPYSVVHIHVTSSVSTMPCSAQPIIRLQPRTSLPLHSPGLWGAITAKPHHTTTTPHHTSGLASWLWVYFVASA